MDVKANVTSRLSGSVRVVALGMLALGTLTTGCKEDDDPEGAAASTTYYADVLPIFEKHCMGCHQSGGIGQFSLADYSVASSRAASIRAHTEARTMPPWLATSDGSCGDFSNSLALSDEQIATIARWAEEGAKAGTAREAKVPSLPSLAGATKLKTPNFTPEIEGSAFAKYDEYRCFLFDAPREGFITGYNVVPGNENIVHHVLAMVVDGDAESELGDGTTNLEQLHALDDASPDREGWSCFGMAGEGVSSGAIPVVWAPGQGVLDYPNQSGIPLKQSDKIIVQIHYNLANPKNIGMSDQTEVQLRIEDDVPNVGVFVLADPFLDSLFTEEPHTLKAGMDSVKYTWQHKLRDFGAQDGQEFDLYGVAPHMHEFGRKYQFSLGQGETANTCATKIERWDFHWQRMYFFDEPYKLTAATPLKVTCDFNTSSVAEDILPGWGTQNEMCLATLYLTVKR